MTLGEKQEIFSYNLSKLIQFAYEKGYRIRLGEVFRTVDQQMLYFEGYSLMKIGSELKLAKRKPRSRTMNSKHMKKLAVDINLFKDGEYLAKREDFKELAEYWKGLHEKNTCGYYWHWDFGHFQMSE